jgi:excisionase family DNA binding protein
MDYEEQLQILREAIDKGYNRAAFESDEDVATWSRQLSHTPLPPLNQEVDMIETPWTFDEAAQFLGCSPRSLRQLYKKWDVPHYHIGSLVRFRKSDLVGLVENRIEGSSGQGGKPLTPKISK